MSPVTHFLIGWSVANACTLSRKERAIITIAGIAPDIDGVGLLFDLFGFQKGLHLKWWSTYHHVLGHNIGFGLLLMITTLAFSTRRWVVSVLAMVSFHLHLIGDLVGSKGPDGYQWPIPYLLPFSDAWQWTWSGQWPLNAWQNVLVTVIVTWYMFYLAWKNEVSPLELVSSKANGSFVAALRQRFGIPKG